MKSLVVYGTWLFAFVFTWHMAVCQFQNYPHYPGGQLPPVAYKPPSVYSPNANAYNVSNNNSHHFQVGVPRYGDFLLYSQVQSKSGKLWRSVSREVSYPPVGTINNRTITCVRALDQYVNGQGGYATLLRGGVGYRNVTLLLKSQSGKGFNFLIEVWGR